MEIEIDVATNGNSDNSVSNLMRIWGQSTVRNARSSLSDRGTSNMVASVDDLVERLHNIREDTREDIREDIREDTNTSSVLDSGPQRGDNLDRLVQSVPDPDTDGEYRVVSTSQDITFNGTNTGNHQHLVDSLGTSISMRTLDGSIRGDSNGQTTELNKRLDTLEEDVKSIRTTQGDINNKLDDINYKLTLLLEI